MLIIDKRLEHKLIHNYGYKSQEYYQRELFLYLNLLIIKSKATINK